MHFGDFLCWNEATNGRKRQHTNKTSIVLMHLSWYLCVIRVPTSRARNDYIIKPRNTSFRISLCILVILYVEMRKQIIQNTSKLKYISSAFALIFQHYLCSKGCKDYDTNLRSTLFKIILCNLVILYVEMRLQKP
jgi:hypothetical protein